MSGRKVGRLEEPVGNSVTRRKIEGDFKKWKRKGGGEDRSMGEMKNYYKRPLEAARAPRTKKQP